MCKPLSQLVAMLLMPIHHLEQWMWMAMALIPMGPSSALDPRQFNIFWNLLHHLGHWTSHAFVLCAHGVKKTMERTLHIGCTSHQIMQTWLLWEYHPKTYFHVLAYHCHTFKELGVWPCYGELHLFVIRRRPLWYGVWGFVWTTNCCCEWLQIGLWQFGACPLAMFVPHL